MIEIEVHILHRDAFPWTVGSGRRRPSPTRSIIIIIVLYACCSAVESQTFKDGAGAAIGCNHLGIDHLTIIMFARL